MREWRPSAATVALAQGGAVLLWVSAGLTDSMRPSSHLSGGCDIAPWGGEIGTQPSYAMLWVAAGLAQLCAAAEMLAPSDNDADPYKQKLATVAALQY